jgi:hypothetical protein
MGQHAVYTPNLKATDSCSCDPQSLQVRQSAEWPVGQQRVTNHTVTKGQGHLTRVGAVAEDPPTFPLTPAPLPSPTVSCWEPSRYEAQADIWWGQVGHRSRCSGLLGQQGVALGGMGGAGRRRARPSPLAPARQRRRRG